MKSFKNELEKLKVGVLFRSIQKENGEPENIALGQVSKELRFFQRQFQYVKEIERVKEELSLTVYFIENCKTCGVPEGVSRQELLVYYQGCFFTLVHQMKDKILQLVNLISEETTPAQPSREKDISISNLLKNKQEILQSLEIEEEIKQWGQKNLTSKIAVVLRKRTHYHHRVSGLKFDKHFLNLDFTDIATKPDFQQSLTDYGKERIEKMQIESFECFFSEALEKAKSTFKAIGENIEKISSAVVVYFKLPISEEEIKKITDEQFKMNESFKVVNKTSIDNIIEPHKEILNLFISKIQNVYKDQISAVYLVGSLGRGEYEEGYSDINIYVILNENEIPVEISRDNLNLNLKIFTKNQFLSEQSEKYRILTKIDGIFMFGTDLTKQEKVPKAGLFLALILIGDILDILNEAEKWMTENPEASPLEISKKSKILAKRIIDFIYGIVMSNKPQYTASRKERIEKILEIYPEMEKPTEILIGVSKHGVGDFENFKNLIEGFKSKAEINLEKMKAVEKGLIEQENLR